MARVNHKLIKQRLNEKRSSITDRQFFSSRILAGHFEDMAAAQTRRYNYNRRVRVSLYWKPNEQHIASTDNEFIRINTGNKIITEVMGREKRYWLVCGLFTHELGHVLYTDFLSWQSYLRFLESYRWYPEPPEMKTTADIRNETDFWNYVKADPKNLQAVQYVTHHISNVLEDGYVENRMLNNFPGTLGLGLETLRDRFFEQMPTVTQMKEHEDSGAVHIFESILQVMLSYAKYGEIKYGDEPLSDVRIQTIFGLIDTIDAALMTRSGKDRLKAVNTILIRCWDYIKDFCELCKKRQQEAEEAGVGGELSETIAGILKSIAGSSSIGTGGMPVFEIGSESENSSTASQRVRTKAAAEKSTEEAQEEIQNKTGSEASESESGKNTALSTESGEDPENADESGEPMEADSVGLGKQKTSESEKGRIPLMQTESLSEPSGGTVEQNDEYRRRNYDRAAADIERVLDKMAEKAACVEMESERIRELNDFAKSISYGDIHSGVNIRINRIADVDTDLVEEYQSICSPLLSISRLLQKSLVKQLEDKRRGGKQTGLLMGRRLESHALHRNDGKVFYKNALPNETPELAVGLLLDESGSMSSCDRCTYARAAAIILYDFCQSLNIPITVYGHSTGYGDHGSTVELYSYAEFDCIDNDDKYRLMDIGARGSNRDGAALRFVAEKLSKRNEEVKILILVSDGQPADSGYYGTAAEEDLRGIQREYQRKGILFVAAAIGNDKQNIERIYGDSFLDITDLNLLPEKLTSVVKRHIRV